MIKNVFSFATLFLTNIYCSQHCHNILYKPQSTLKETKKTTWLTFQYVGFNITLHNLFVYQHTKTRKEYIDFSACYEKISEYIDCTISNLEISVTQLNKLNYSQIKISAQTYVPLHILKNQDTSLKIILKNKNSLKKFFCCFCNKNN